MRKSGGHHKEIRISDAGAEGDSGMSWSREGNIGTEIGD
jgi:hypothetical protein